MDSDAGQVVIVAQGDELLTGQTLDTNSHWLAGRLFDVGLGVRRVISAPDRLDDLVDVLRQASELAPAVICTGGLGPTGDDLTAQAASLAFDAPLEHREDAWAQVQAIFASRGRTPTEADIKQALLPRGSRVLENRWGTAPGFEIRGAWFLPGVPREMRPMFTEHILPRLVERLVGRPPVTHVLRVIGLPEAELQVRLRDFERPGMRVGYRAVLPENQVKLRFEGSVAAEERAEALAEARRRIGSKVFGVDTGDLAEVVGARLTERGDTLALAESCTAGGLAAWIASVPGASQYLLEGAVVYSNEAKVRAAGVTEAMLLEHGAVSEPVARQLAIGIRERAGATWGIGITGIAGPGGGTPDKPVGTVHLAVAGPGGVDHKQVVLPGPRDFVQKLAMAGVLLMLWRRLQ